MTLPGWPPRDWRALLALVASVLGSAALTVFAAWLVWILWRGGWAPGTELRRIDLLGKALLISLVGSLIVLLALGLAINHRMISVGRGGFEMSGGDEDAPPVPPTAVVTTKTTVSTPDNQV